MKRIIALTALMGITALSASAQDKIATKGGDTLDCHITGATDAHIRFTTPDEQARKVGRNAIKSVYYGGQWQSPTRLAIAMEQIDEEGYADGILNTESQYHTAALYLDRSGAAMATSGILTAVGLLVAVLFAGEDWATYTGAAMGGIGLGLLIRGGYDQRRAAVELSRL